MASASGPRARKRRAILHWMAWGTFYAFMFPFLSMTILFKLGLAAALVASALTALLGGPCMTWVFLILVPYTRRLPFYAAIALQAGAILSIVAVGFYVSSVIIGSMSSKVAPWDTKALRGAFNNLAFNPDMRPAYSIAIGLMLLMIVGGQIGAKLGPGVIWSWAFGRYHRPKEEQRIFMFLDLKDSTSLAGRLGSLRFTSLIQMFFSDLGQTLSDFKGEVSHYIGDEAVIFWKPQKGLKDANCVRFFFALEEQIAERASEYRQRFDVVPGFKAGLHIGRVVAAEVGSGKSEIALYGDAVNVAARITALCSELDWDLLISKELADALEGIGRPLTLETMGLRALKGKSDPVEVLSPCPPD